MDSFDTLIIDGDSLLYACGFAAEGEPVENALHSFKLQVQRIEEACRCFVETVYIKGGGNFRDALAKTRIYKANRKQPPPEHYQALVDYAIEYQKAEKVFGMEADDICSVRLYANRGHKSRFVLAAQDKDLWNTPGWHYNFRKDTLEYIDMETANLNFIRQLLTGDDSDNVPGLPELYVDGKAKRCGPKTAQKYLEGLNSTDAMKAVYKAYSDYGYNKEWSPVQTADYFLEQGRLLWMTRRLNEDGSPVLWNPPKFLNGVK